MSEVFANCEAQKGSVPMRVTGKVILVVGLFVSLALTAGAQNSSSKRMRPSTHRQQHHKAGAVTVPDESKHMNADLTKLENQGTRIPRSARRSSQKAVVPSTKQPTQERAGNPPINFESKGTGKAAMTRSNGGSRGSGSGVRTAKMR